MNVDPYDRENAVRDRQRNKPQARAEESDRDHDQQRCDGGRTNTEAVGRAGEGDAGDEQRDARVLRHDHNSDRENGRGQHRAHDRNPHVTADSVKRVERDLVQPLAIDPRHVRAGERQRIETRNGVMVDDPAAGSQVPEVVVAADRRDGSDGGQHEEPGRRDPLRH